MVSNRNDQAKPLPVKCLDSDSDQSPLREISIDADGPHSKFNEDAKVAATLPYISKAPNFNNKNSHQNLVVVSEEPSEPQRIYPLLRQTRLFGQRLVKILAVTLVFLVLGVIGHDLTRVLTRTAVPFEEFSIYALKVTFPETDQDDVRISANASLSNHLLSTGLQLENLQCNLFSYDAGMLVLNATKAQEYTRLASMDLRRPFKLPPYTADRVNKIELHIFNVNTEAMSNLKRDQTNLRMAAQCQAAIDFDLLGVMPHPLKVILMLQPHMSMGSIFERRLHSWNSEFLQQPNMTSSADRNRIVAISNTDTLKHNTEHIFDTNSDTMSSSGISTHSFLSSISMSHVKLRGGKHGMVGLNLQAAYGHLFNQTYWSQKWTNSEMRSNGMLSKLTTAVISLPKLSVNTRAQHPMDEKRGVSVNLQSQSADIDLLPILENAVHASPKVAIEIVCEYRNGKGSHNCIRAGFSELRDEVRGLEDSLDLRKLLRYSWDNLYKAQDGDPIATGISNLIFVDEYERDNNTSLIGTSHRRIVPSPAYSWSSDMNQWEFGGDEKAPIARMLLEAELPLLSELDPKETFFMNMTCDNLLCDFGNDAAQTRILMGVSDKHVACEVEVGTSMHATVALVGGETQDGDLASYVSVEMLWDSEPVL
ncbi:hypothetical protein CYMTET_38570, partial [Cymbomonas tetramitiformis]